MKNKTPGIIKSIVFIALFFALFAAFFNEKKTFSSGVLTQFYGNRTTNIIGVVVLLAGWVFWEIGIGKRESRLIILIGGLLIIVGSILVAQILGFIGIAIAASAMVFFSFWVIKKKQKEDIIQD